MSIFSNPYLSSFPSFNRFLNFQDDFSSYATQGAADAAWVSTNTANDRVNITNDNLAFTFKRATATSIAYDLGSNQSNTSWLLRFRFNITAQTANNKQFALGLFDSDQTVASNSGAQDYICATFGISGSAPGTVHDLASGVGDGVTLEGYTSGTAITVGASNWASSTDYFVELKRVSATSIGISLSSTSAYSGDLGSNTQTIPSTVQSLRYIKISDWYSFSGAGDTGTAIIDDLYFYDGRSSL